MQLTLLAVHGCHSLGAFFDSAWIRVHGYILISSVLVAVLSKFATNIAVRSVWMLRLHDCSLPGARYSSYSLPSVT